MVKLSQLKTDPDLEVDGVWVPWIEGVNLRIARTANSKLIAWYRQETQPYVDAARAKGEEEEDAVPDDVSKKLTQEGLARFVLVDWTGIENDDGSVLEYSPAKAEELFNTPGLGDELMVFVMRAAKIRANYCNKVLEDSLGN